MLAKTNSCLDLDQLLPHNPFLAGGALNIKIINARKNCFLKVQNKNTKILKFLSCANNIIINPFSG